MLVALPDVLLEHVSSMLAAPDGSGKMQVCPTVESRLRLLQARLALAEHPTTLRTHVGADELQTQRKVMDHVIEQYTSRLTYARWLHDALSREDAAASAAESVASSEGVPFSISDGGGGGPRGISECSGACAQPVDH